MRKTTRIFSLAPIVAGLVLTLAGCKPEYPSCDTDKDCKEKEFCVGRKCQQCRDSADCKEGFSCSGGACKAIPGFCKDKSACPAGQECIANQCRPCVSDNECASGLKCHLGECKKPTCTKDDDCAQNEECQKGFCTAANKKPVSGPPCPLSPVYFGFNESTLTSEATSTLSSNAECLKKAADRSISLTGRADPRGTVEYNMALSDKRAQATRDHLKRLGLDVNKMNPVPRGAIDANGTDEASWAKDRRVDFDWK